MKKSIVLPVLITFTLVAGNLIAHAQVPAKDDKPIFYHLVPGTYVHGYPRFTIHYPKDWVEQRSEITASFRAAPPGASKSPVGYKSPALVVHVVAFKGFDPPMDIPLDQNAQFVVSLIKPIAKDMKLTYNKPSSLRDGTPAYEFEIAALFDNRWSNTTQLVTNWGNLRVALEVEYGGGEITDDLKAMLHSLEFEMGHDTPAVQVPPDVQEFFDTWRNAALSHDIPKIMTHYSDRYLNSGDTKVEVERFWKMDVNDVTSAGPVTVYDFVPAEDRAYLTGGLHFRGIKLGAKGVCGS